MCRRNCGCSCGRCCICRGGRRIALRRIWRKDPLRLGRHGRPITAVLFAVNVVAVVWRVKRVCYRRVDYRVRGGHGGSCRGRAGCAPGKRARFCACSKRSKPIGRSRSPPGPAALLVWLLMRFSLRFSSCFSPCLFLWLLYDVAGSCLEERGGTRRQTEGQADNANWARVCAC